MIKDEEKLGLMSTVAAANTYAFLRNRLSSDPRVVFLGKATPLVELEAQLADSARTYEPTLESVMRLYVCLFALFHANDKWQPNFTLRASLLATKAPWIDQAIENIESRPSHDVPSTRKTVVLKAPLPSTTPQTLPATASVSLSKVQFPTSASYQCP